MIQLKRVRKKSEPQVAEDKKGQIFDLDKIKGVTNDIENRLIDEKIIDEFSIEE